MDYKRATLLGCMRKVYKSASDVYQFRISAATKLKEFEELGYPTSQRRYVCAIMAKDTGDTFWFRIRDLQ